MPETEVNDLSRRSSYQPIVPADDTTSLTSFPDPATTTTSPNLQAVSEPLHGLLDDAGPSMFDEQEPTAEDPQTLSAARTEVIERVIAHRGAVELVRQLAALLAERDAHVTALTRLAEEYDIPTDRVVDTANWVKQAERRRLSLTIAAQDEVQTTSSPDNNASRTSEIQLGPNGTVRGFTKLFAGSRRPRDVGQSAGISLHSRTSSRSTSVAAPKKERPRSLDVQSITSVESSGWTSAIFGGTGIKGFNSGNRRDSRTLREPVEMSTRRDKDQLPPTLSQPSSDPQESEWNRFFLRLMKSREQAGEDARSGELIGASRFGNEGAAGRQKMEMLTRLVIGGIPMHLRHPIWMELTNTHAIMQPDAYEYYLNLRENEDPREIDAILKDVPRTLTSKYDFYAEKGHDRLKRVLVAFVSKYPGLGYTQGLNMIAGYLLLAIPDESDAFWVLCKMVDRYFPPDYFSPATALSGPIADNVVLRQYVRELLPRLADRLDEWDVDAAHTVPLSWFLTAFASVMPAAALLRVWDVWLGLPHQATFLFNVALTLLSLHARELVDGCASASEYFAYMSGRCKVPDEPDRITDFVKQAFVMRKKLEQVEVRRALATNRLKKHPSTDALYAQEPAEEQQQQPAGAGSA